MSSISGYTIKCDRCKHSAFIAEDDIFTGGLKKVDFHRIGDDIHLCGLCYLDFETFMRWEDNDNDQSGCEEVQEDS